MSEFEILRVDYIFELLDEVILSSVVMANSPNLTHSL